MVAVTLLQSPWGLGQLHDTLQLFAENRYGTRYAVSPTVVLHLVEAVLGYSPAGGDSGGSVWRYRKDVEFRRS